MTGVNRYDTANRCRPSQEHAMPLPGRQRLDPARRPRTAVLIDLWAGKMVRDLGDVIVDGVRATPGPVQQPLISMWFGTKCSDGPPTTRAARYDGVFPIGPRVVKPEHIGSICDHVASAQGNLNG